METGKTICEIALWTNWIHTGSMQVRWVELGNFRAVFFFFWMLGMRKKNTWTMEILGGKGGAKKDLKPIK